MIIKTIFKKKKTKHLYFNQTIKLLFITILYECDENLFLENFIFFVFVKIEDSAK